MPLEFLKRNKQQPAEPRAPEPEAIEAQAYSLRITYGAKSSDGVRMKARPGVSSDLPNMLAGLVDGAIDVVEPLEVEFGEASPAIERPREAMQWLNAHQDLSPVTLHGLVVLETRVGRERQGRLVLPEERVGLAPLGQRAQPGVLEGPARVAIPRRLNWASRFFTLTVPGVTPTRQTVHWLARTRPSAQRWPQHQVHP